MQAKPIKEIRLPAGPARALRFTHDGRHLLTGAANGSLTEWSLSTGIPTRILQGHRGAITSIDLLPDGSRYVTASTDKTAIIWNAESGTPVATCKGHKGGVLSAAFSPAGPQVITMGTDNRVGYWDEETGTNISFAPISKHARQIAVLHDGHLAASGEHGQMHVLDPLSGDTTHTYLGPNATLAALVLSPSHPALAALTHDGHLHLFNSEDGATYDTWRLGAGPWESLAFSSDGAGLYCAGANGIVGFDLRDGSQSLSIETPLRTPICLAISPADDAIAVSSGKGTIALWSF